MRGQVIRPVHMCACVHKSVSLSLSLSHTHTPYTTHTNTHWGRLALLHTSTCSAEGERSAHLSSLKSRCDSKFFRPLWDGRSCYSSQDGGQGSGCLMIEEKRSKFILLRALCQVPVAYCWEPLTHHRVTAPEVTSTAINLPRLLNLLPSPAEHEQWERLQLPLLLLIVTQMKKGRGENIDSPFDAADGVRPGHWVCGATGGVCMFRLMVVLCVSLCERMDGLWIYIWRKVHFLYVTARLSYVLQRVIQCILVFRGELGFLQPFFLKFMAACQHCQFDNWKTE